MPERTIYPKKWKTDPKYKGVISSGVGKLVDYLVGSGKLASFNTSKSKYEDFGSGAIATYTNPENPEQDIYGIHVKAGSPRGGNPGTMHELVHLIRANYPTSEYTKAAKKYGDYIVSPKIEQRGLQERLVRRQIPAGMNWSGITREGEPLAASPMSVASEIPAYYYTEPKMQNRELRAKHLKGLFKASGMDIPANLVNAAVGDMLSSEERSRTFAGGSSSPYVLRDMNKLIKEMKQRKK